MLEFDLIDRLRGRIRPRKDVLLGVGDDAALLQPPQGEPLVVTTDTLNAGVHFPVETHPEDLGWKTLAVSVSDLAAMGATPRWCTLSLSLLQVDMAWIDAFADGFFELADLHGLVLVGGDTTYGPLATSVTAIGCVPPGMALRRDGACIGDDIWVTGRPGEAAAALAMWCAGMLDITKCAPDPRCEILRQRLLRPTPRVEVGLALRGLVHAAVDLSDGLLADLGHICASSGVGAVLECTSLPRVAVHGGWDEAQVASWQLAGGDDYELCFTAAPQCGAPIQDVCATLGVEVTRIGRIVVGETVQVLNAAGVPLQLSRKGYQHFMD
ncbi:MAG TPA: thiamine-phosphate kinase [Xylella fastidiosa subsp. multiplex]